MDAIATTLRLFLIAGSLVLTASSCARQAKHQQVSQDPQMVEDVPSNQNEPGAADAKESAGKSESDLGSSSSEKEGKEGPLNAEAPAPPAPSGGITVPIPQGMPTSGTVFNLPIEAPTRPVNVGSFWSVLLPPRYHVISFASNKTFEGPSAIEYGQVMNDPLSRSPFCDGNHENGIIMSALDGLGVPYSYCLRYFNSELGYRVFAGADRGINHVELSSPAQEPATYERFYFASRDVRDPETPEANPPLSRFDAFCAANFNQGAVTMAIINNWWNDPLSPRPVRVRWCQTQIGVGFGGPIDVWVAGFFFEEKNGASNNAAQATIEMTFVASAAGIPTGFNPVVFLRGAAYRVRAMLVQTGLNAPFNNFTP